MNYKSRVLSGNSWSTLQMNINDFLKAHPGIIIQHMTQSSARDTSGDYPETITTVVIIYTVTQ